MYFNIFFLLLLRLQFAFEECVLVGVNGPRPARCNTFGT